MSSVQPLREFISERLTAAAAEIFSEFEKTILRYEEEIDRQRRLLDLCWKPELKLHRVVLQQEPVHKTHILKDQQLCKQQRNSSLNQKEPEPPQFENQVEPEPPQVEDQVEPEPPQIKVEEQELCINQEEDQLHLKQETVPVMVTALNVENESGPDKEQLIPQSSAGPEDQDRDSGSNEKTDHTKGCHGNQAGPSATSERLFSCKICGETFLEKSLHFRHVKVHKVWNQNSEKLMYSCPTCGKKIPAYSKLVVHMMFHAGEKPFSCRLCRKHFTSSGHCRRHARIHTGEKPFSCKTCGKCFSHKPHLKRHMRTHTGEKPFSCKLCGKKFASNGNCADHMRCHTGEKPFICKSCGKSFTQTSSLRSHMKMHTGEQLFSCEHCEKKFSSRGHCERHVRIHTGEKPFSCKTCGKSFNRKSHLNRHMNVHRD